VPIATALGIAQKITAGQASSTIHIGATALLGVRTSTATHSNGATVQSVVSDGPAAKAGLAAGDVITAVNSTTVASPTDLSSAISAFHPGDKATLTWIDGSSGQQKSGSVTFGTGPPA
jgi:S1-C subfamily serine protease